MNDAVREAMEMRHQLKRNADHANVMGMEIVLWVYVTSKLENVFARITLKG